VFYFVFVDHTCTVCWSHTKLVCSSSNQSFKKRCLPQQRTRIKEGKGLRKGGETAAGTERRRVSNGQRSILMKGNSFDNLPGRDTPTLHSAHFSTSSLQVKNPTHTTTTLLGLFLCYLCKILISDYLCANLYTHIHIYTHTHLSAYMHTYLYIQTCIHKYTHTFIYIHTYSHIYPLVPIYYIHTPTYIH